MNLHRRTVVSILIVFAGVIAIPASPSGAATRVRGFDGTTLKVGGLGPFSTFPDADVGTRARLARANAAKEVKGITFEVTGYRDDGNSTAAAAAAAAGLVNQDGVFAIVPNLSQFTPGAMLTRRGVPWFGWGIDPSYCTVASSETGFGFGYSGCLAPISGGRVPATGTALYGAVSATTGSAAPTVAVVSTATDGGRRMVSASATSLAAAGFDVVYAKGLLAVPPDLYPASNAQELLESHGGGPPDAVVCLATSNCQPLFQLLRANNYLGTLSSQLSTDTAMPSVAGMLATPQYVPLTQHRVAQERMLTDVHSVKPDAALTPGVVAGYLAADMLVAVVGRLQRDGTSITPRNVQQAASRMTFGVPGLFGPVRYPMSFVRSSPACEALVRATGTGWEQVDTFSCTRKTVPLDPRFAQVY